MQKEPIITFSNKKLATINIVCTIGILYTLIRQAIKLDYTAIITLILMVICVIMQITVDKRNKNPVHFN